MYSGSDRGFSLKAEINPEVQHQDMQEVRISNQKWPLLTLKNV